MANCQGRFLRHSSFSPHPRESRSRSADHHGYRRGTGLADRRFARRNRRHRTGGPSWKHGHTRQDRQIEHRCLDAGWSASGEPFAAAEAVTTVPAEPVAIVAHFRLVEHAVAATCARTVETAPVGERIAVTLSFVTFFTGFDTAIPAEEREEPTVVAAAVGERRVMERRLALFPKELLQDAVTAAAGLEETHTITPIEVA